MKQVSSLKAILLKGNAHVRCLIEWKKVEKTTTILTPSSDHGNYYKFYSIFGFIEMACFVFHKTTIDELHITSNLWVYLRTNLSTTDKQVFIRQDKQVFIRTTLDANVNEMCAL